MKGYSLHLDSSGKYLIVLLSKDGQLIDKTFYEAYLRQSEVMVDEIDKIISRNKISREDLSSIVVGIGPGSYTGVRISIVIAKILAFALKIKIFAVSSLSLLKNPQNNTICVLNAKAGRVYFAAYGKNEEIIVPPSVYPIEKAAQYIKDNPTFSVSGDAHLFNLKSYEYDMCKMLLDAKKECNLVSNIFTLNPIYLKDYYVSNTHLEIAKATMEHLDKILEIENECFIAPWKKEDIEFELTKNPINRFYVLLLNKEVIGFINYFVSFTTSSIAQIAITKEHRKKGYGKMLLERMEEDLKKNKEEKCEYITLEVRKSNIAAINFYEKNGYKFITSKKAYYKDGEDALYFVKELER